MGQPFVGQVIAVGFNFVPQGWLACDGSTRPISQYDVLYNLLGTTYGGDGMTTFAVPDLRGRTPIAAGQGGNLSNHVLGQLAGAEQVSLTPSQIGSHTHTVMASTQAGTLTVPAGNAALAQVADPTVHVFGVAPGNTALAGAAVGPSGSNQPHENRQPFLTINYIICWAGIYPSQS